MHFGIGAVGFTSDVKKPNSADAKMHPDREPLTTGTPCYGRIGTMVNPASGEGRETARNVT